MMLTVVTGKLCSDEETKEEVRMEREPPATHEEGNGPSFCEPIRTQPASDPVQVWRRQTRTWFLSAGSNSSVKMERASSSREKEKEREKEKGGGEGGAAGGGGGSKEAEKRKRSRAAEKLLSSSNPASPGGAKRRRT